jgi:hypothetical protein
MWVNAKEREKNKEKHVNGAMFLTSTVTRNSIQRDTNWISYPGKLTTSQITSTHAA